MPALFRLKRPLGNRLLRPSEIKAAVAATCVIFYIDFNYAVQINEPTAPITTSSMLSLKQQHIWVVALFLLTGLAPVSAEEQADITAAALFKDRALLIINGERRLLKAGQTSPEGVALISSNSKQATVQLNGEQITVLLGNKITSGFKKRAARSIQLTPSAGGHYLISGSINGRAANFLVDTGATYISLSGDEADRLGLKYIDGRKGRSSTAAGIVTAYQIELNRVRIGDIEQKT